MNDLKRNFEHERRRLEITYSKTFVNLFKWILISIAVGIIVGIMGTSFHLTIEKATEMREKYSFLIWFLPLGGMFIVWFYKIMGLEHDKGTNMVLMTVRENSGMTLKNMFCIFVGSAVTHLFGGSSGREGAALQIGGSIAYRLGEKFRLDEYDLRIITMCGMSAGFSALFGTPIAASFFAMEVISIGILHYSAIVPCVISAATALGISSQFGVKAAEWQVQIPDISIINLIKVLLLALLCGALSYVFCVAMRETGKLYKHFIKNSYLRIAVAGLLVALLTFAVGSNDYNGTGMKIISRSFETSAGYEVFILKMIFTALTLTAGFKGGEIVPVFFIGSAFGSALSGILGLPCSLCAGIGLASLFCGVTNCPITSMLLCIELFGSEGILYFGIACAVAYMTSGYEGLYSEQKILYSKFKPKFIDKKIGR
ncbi:MAG: chloride channel protein [Oscillospiraceae bacterium]